MHVVRVRCENKIPNLLLFLLYLFIYMWNDKLWGQVECVLLEGGKEKGVVFFQKSPWKVSMMLILITVSSDLRSIWKKWEVKHDCNSFSGCARGARFSTESWSHCLPHSLFLCWVPFF